MHVLEIRSIFSFLLGTNVTICKTPFSCLNHYGPQSIFSVKNIGRKKKKQKGFSIASIPTAYWNFIRLHSGQEDFLLLLTKIMPT